MARPKKAPDSSVDVDSITKDLLSELNKLGTGSEAYLQGDHAEHTWGIKIPHLAFQWLIGGSTVLPLQRYLGISGLAKSFKSTLVTEIGNWFILNGGLHLALDNENKTSPTMYDAMTWFKPELTNPRRIFKATKSVDEWQQHTTKAVKYAKATSDRPKGQRIPVFISVDSLTGTSTEAAQEALNSEGSAAARGYPVAAAQITNYLEALSLIGTTASVGFVQHLKVDMSNPAGYTGPNYKEKGASAATFASTVHLRVTKGSAERMAGHPFAPKPDLPVEGYTLHLQTERSCVGPDHRRLAVRLLWQYVPQEDGPDRQAMWYDWEWALGNLLVEMKYNDKMKLYAADKERLEQAIYFTQPKSGVVKCEALGLDGVDLAQFGRAIMESEAIFDKVKTFLRITDFVSVQDADIDFGTEDE
jgi:hypothetical protein